MRVDGVTLLRGCCAADRRKRRRREGMLLPAAASANAHHGVWIGYGRPYCGAVALKA